MSAGGIFKLIANDGKADRMIMATELLNNRIKDIMCARSQRGFADPTPTLVDIERTHILYVNAHFRPFAALGFEYNKTRTNTGTAQFAGSIQFSIPQFGDFFSDMVVNAVLSATQATTGTVPALPDFIGASNQGYLDSAGAYSTVAPATIYGKVSGVANATSGVYTKYTQEYVDLAGNILAVGAAAQNYVRYCEYPGERIFKKVKLEVNSNPLDDYTTEVMIYHRKFRVGVNKLIGWKRLVGQEVPIEGYTDLMSVSGASSYPAAATDLVDVSGNAVPGPVTAGTTARRVVQIVSGPQTPQLRQPALDLWIPLIFWFNRDSRLAIASVSIPYGQRFITIDIDSQANLLSVAPGNLFLRTTVEEETSADAGSKGTMAAVAVSKVAKYITRTPVLANGSVIDSTQTISSMELYINNIFLNPEIHDIYIKRIAFSLIRVYRYQTNRTTSSRDNLLLSQLKWPVETMFVGMRPTVNIAATNANQYRDWHRLTLLTDNIINVAANSAGDVMIDDTVAFNAASIKHKKVTTQENVERIAYPVSTRTVDTLKLQAHGIDIFQEYNSKFFSDYFPYTYGGININTPEDTGAFMLNFALYPGTYQPSGHMNVSRAREFYLEYVSGYVTASTPADLITVAVCINFLLISDGSAVLRYTT